MEPWRKNLTILWGTQFLAMVGMNLVVPFLPFYIRQLGITDPKQLAFWSGMVFAGPFLMAFIATPFWGSLGDKYGRKLMVIRALFGLGVAQIFIGFSQDVYQLLFFRVLQGAISGFIAATLALVSTSTPKEKVGYALGLLQSATAGGAVLGPAVGGILADFISYREIFFLVAILCFIGGGIVWWKVEVSTEHHDGAEKPGVLQNFKYFFSDRQLRLVAILIVVAQGAALMIEPIFALFIEGFNTETRYVSTLTGVIFSIAGVFMVFSAPWWGRRNDRLGYKRNLIWAFGGTGVAYALHIIVPNLVALGVLRAALGFARGGILHALYSVTSLRSPSDRKSGLIGIAASLAILGNMIGPLLGGMIAGQFSMYSVFAVNSALFLFGCYIAWRAFAEPRHARVAEASEVLDLAKAEETARTS